MTFNSDNHLASLGTIRAMLVKRDALQTEVDALDALINDARAAHFEASQDAYRAANPLRFKHDASELTADDGNDILSTLRRLSTNRLQKELNS